MLHRLSLRIKLLLAFSLLIAMMAAGTLLNYSSLGTLSRLSAVQADRTADQLTAQRIKNAVAVMYSFQADVIINENSLASEGYRTQNEKLAADIKLLRATADTEEEKAWVSELDTQTRAYTDSFQTVYQLFRNSKMMNAADLKLAYKKADDETDQIKEKIFDLIDSLTASNDEQFDRAREQFDRTLASILKNSLILLGITIVAGFGLALLNTRLLMQPIRKLVGAAHIIAQGDLTAAMPEASGSEIGQLAASFGRMVDGLKGLIREAEEHALAVSAASDELSAGADQTSRATEHIAELMQRLSAANEDGIRSVRQAASDVEHIRLGAAAMAEDAGQVVEAAAQAKQRTDSGLVEVESAVGQMETVSEIVERMSGVIEQLARHSAEIQQTNGFIRSLAAKTNMLALNAGIEAARAGEHGRGFTVVAVEIRKLAEQSSVSSEQIGALLDAVGSQVAEAVATMQTVRAEMTAGKAAVQGAGHRFHEIAGSISEVHERIASMERAIWQIKERTVNTAASTAVIAEAADASATAAESVSAATEQQLASMEEIASSTTHLSSMAENLHRLLSRFRTR